jgi:membrane protease YdiL (CAAX protease family)
MRLVLLALEFSVLFIALPLLIYLRVIPNLPIPYLLFGAIAVILLVHRSPGFSFAQLFSTSNILPNLGPLLLRDFVCMVFLGLAVRLFAPDLLFSFVRRAPALWALVMLLYPLVSVLPQELLYRVFFFQRYEPLFGNGWAMLLASALAFGFVHIIFGNWLSVILCIFGGFLFALTYHSSGSLLLACLDHAIFGNFIFTIGLGKFFYHGSRF